MTRRMVELGIEGVRVDRPTIGLIADWIGIRELPPLADATPRAFRQLADAVSARDRELAAEAFASDPRDTATPRGMASLLAKIHRGEALGEQSTERLLDTMRRCRTGADRLKGLLPAGTVVAHKTGTIGGTTNDVGIITLPDDAGHVAIAAFVKGSERPVERRERAIAEVSRAVYDFFLFCR